MLDRPTGNVPNASTVVLVSLDFSDGDYAENLEELRQLAASDGLAISAVVKGKRSGLILPPSRAVARWTKSRWH